MLTRFKTFKVIKFIFIKISKIFKALKIIIIIISSGVIKKSYSIIILYNNINKITRSLLYSFIKVISINLLLFIFNSFDIFIIINSFLLVDILKNKIYYLKNRIRDIKYYINKN